MADALLALIWLASCVICFVSGGYLIGPNLYGRSLRREMRDHPLTGTPPDALPDPDDFRRWLEQIRDDG